MRTGWDPMQDYTHDDHDAPVGGASAFANFKTVASTVIGAAIAVSLLLAIGVWFYRLGVRDARNVPIIRAALEPAKERPADPGGLVTAHQDVTSYEVAESEPVRVSAAVIAPEPPKPDREDIAMSVLAEVKAQQEAAARAQIASQAVTSPVPAPAVAEPVLATTSVSPAVEPETDTSESTESEPAVPAAQIIGTEQAPGRSPVAPVRPKDLLARAEAAAREAELSVNDLARSAASSAVQVQLAADPNESYIRNRWKEIYKANSDVLRGRELAVQTTVSGGKTFYRLRVGPFENGAEARAVCQALKARGQDCIVARNS